MLTETSSTRTSRHESSELLIVKRTVIIVHIQSAAAAAILDSVSFIARSSVDAPSCSLLCGRHQLSVRLLWLIICLRVSSKEYEKYWENLYCWEVEGMPRKELHYVQSSLIVSCCVLCRVPASLCCHDVCCHSCVSITGAAWVEDSKLSNFFVRVNSVFICLRKQLSRMHQCMSVIEPDCWVTVLSLFDVDGGRLVWKLEWSWDMEMSSRKCWVYKVYKMEMSRGRREQLMSGKIMYFELQFWAK